jgi:hypothetical protein
MKTRSKAPGEARICPEWKEPDTQGRTIMKPIRLVLAVLAGSLLADLAPAQWIVPVSYPPAIGGVPGYGYSYAYSMPMVEAAPAAVQLPTAVEALPGGGHHAAAAVERPVTGCCNEPCEHSCGLVGGGEWLLLKPHFSQPIGAIFTSINDRGYDEYESAWRAWSGVQTRSGLGMVVRYLEFDDSATAAHSFLAPTFGAPMLVNVSLNAAVEGRVFDAEVTHAFRLGSRYHLLIDGGYRYVEYEENNFLTFSPFQISTLTSGSHSRNHGLVLGGELHRRVGGYLGLFFGARAATVFGDDDVVFQATPQLFFGGFPQGTVTDTVKFMWEGRAGAEWNLELSNGAVVFVRAAAEVQYWDRFSSGGAFGLAGGSVAVGLYR